MDSLVYFAGLSILALACLVALASLVIGLPGTFIILGSAILYAWATGFESVAWSTVGWLAGLSLFGEALELASGAVGGGGERPTRRTAIAAIVGGMIGGVLGAPILFGLGALLGALAGAFAGASLASLSQQGDVRRALRSGAAAMRGRFLGFVAKLAVAAAMIVILFSAAL